MGHSSSSSSQSQAALIALSPPPQLSVKPKPVRPPKQTDVYSTAVPKFPAPKTHRQRNPQPRTRTGIRTGIGTEPAGDASPPRSPIRWPTAVLNGLPSRKSMVRAERARPRRDVPGPHRAEPNRAEPRATRAALLQDAAARGRRGEGGRGGGRNLKRQEPRTSTGRSWSCANC